MTGVELSLQQLLPLVSPVRKTILECLKDPNNKDIKDGIEGNQREDGPSVKPSASSCVYFTPHSFTPHSPPSGGIYIIPHVSHR